MNAKVEVQNNKLDVAMWVSAVVLFVLALGTNYYFSSISLSLRMIGWIVIFAGILGILATTQKGQVVIEFAQEARIELRKVVWPTRQETLHTTAVIIGLIMLMGVILWCLDSVLLWAVGWLTGQRG